jgi:sortase A
MGQRVGGALLGNGRTGRDTAQPFRYGAEPPKKPSRLARSRDAGSVKLRIASVQARAARESLRTADEETLHSRVVHAALVLSLIGLSLVVFLMYTFVFTGLQEARTQHSLLERFTLTGSSSVAAFSNLLTGHDVKEGQPVGLLEIGALNLHLVVVKGTSSTDLMSGPGLMDGSALPGTKGNSVIAGRRSTAGAPFANLLTLHLGTKFDMVDGLGRFVYQVTSVGTAAPGSVDPISPTSHAQLTLVTSNPAFDATGRAYVIAKLLTKPSPGPASHQPPSASQRGLGGDSGAIFPAILWGIVFIGSLFLMVGIYRRWSDRLWTIYLLSTPVVLAIALLCFANVYRLLPATL